MNLVIDMNLSPSWCDFFAVHGHDAVHWSNIGSVTDTDETIMNWASLNARVVLTHDLDFGAILASTQARSPSVMQVRSHSVLPKVIGRHVLDALAVFEGELASGAIIVVDLGRSRARVLPIMRS